MKRIPTFLTGLLACVCGAVHAQVKVQAQVQAAASTQSEAAAVLGLTVNDAVALAQANSPRLKEAAALTRQARAGVQTATAYSNPRLEVYQGRQYARPIATPGVPGLLQHYAVYQPVEIPKERTTRREAAELTTEASRFGEQGASLSVVADTKHAFYAALKQQEEISHAEENLLLVEDLRRRVAVEVKVGEKGGLELTRATAEVARAQFDVRSAQLEYRQALAGLRLLLAVPTETGVEPKGGLEPRRVLPEPAALRGQVMSTHPALKEANKQRDAADRSLAGERALRIPRPVVFAEFENQPDLRFWRAGVSVPLPIFDRRRGQIEAAAAQVGRAEALEQQRTLELAAALERAYEQYQLADQQATSLESGAMRAAEGAVSAAQAAYRFGERGIVEVLDAQRVLQSVRGDLLNAQFARQDALVDLEELGAVQAAAGTRP